MEFRATVYQERRFARVFAPQYEQSSGPPLHLVCGGCGIMSLREMYDALSSIDGRSERWCCVAMVRATDYWIARYWNISVVCMFVRVSVCALLVCKQQY